MTLKTSFLSKITYLRKINCDSFPNSSFALLDQGLALVSQIVTGIFSTESNSFYPRWFWSYWFCSQCKWMPASAHRLYVRCAVFHEQRSNYNNKKDSVLCPKEQCWLPGLSLHQDHNQGRLNKNVLVFSMEFPLALGSVSQGPVMVFITGMDRWGGGCLWRRIHPRTNHTKPHYCGPLENLQSWVDKEGGNLSWVEENVPTPVPLNAITMGVDTDHI